MITYVSGDNSRHTRLTTVIFAMPSSSRFARGLLLFILLLLSDCPSELDRTAFMDSRLLNDFVLVLLPDYLSLFDHT